MIIISLCDYNKNNYVRIAIQNIGHQIKFQCCQNLNSNIHKPFILATRFIYFKKKSFL